MANTKIEWATKSWNPITGCTKVSAGCQNCYAKRMAKRLAGRYGYPKDNPFAVTPHPERLQEPLSWKKPQRIFVCSMGDLFHEAVSFSFVRRVLDIVDSCPQHTFLFLTKRPERMEYYPRRNVWLGVSVENQETEDERIPLLLQPPAAKRFVSYEPALGPVDFSAFLPES